MEDLITEQEILNNYDKYVFKCQDKVAVVREYLEEKLGFKKAKWSTSQYHKLKYLYITPNREVNGTVDYTYSRIPVSISHLIYLDILNNEGVYHTSLDTSEFKKIELVCVD